MKHFLSNNDVVYCCSAWNETALKRNDKRIQPRPDSLHNDLGKDFVTHIIQADGKKLVNVTRACLLWNKTYDSVKKFF